MIHFEGGWVSCGAYNRKIPNLSNASQRVTDDDAEQTSILPQHSLPEPAVVQCSMCPSHGLSFSSKTEYLHHVCADHLGEEQLKDFPEFLPNDIFEQAMKLPV